MSDYREPETASEVRKMHAKLIQTGKLRHFPVVLFGSRYCSGFVD